MSNPDSGKFLLKLTKPTQILVLKPQVSRLVQPGQDQPDVAMEPKVMTVMSINDVRAIRSMVVRGMLCEVPSLPITDQLVFYALEQQGLAVREEVQCPETAPSGS